MAEAQVKHHDYHLVDPSPWPVVGSVSAFIMALGAIGWMHHMFSAAPIVFGWIGAGHQLGAASAAFMAGVMRTEFGSYQQAFEIAGATGLVAAGAALMIGRGPKRPTFALP